MTKVKVKPSKPGVLVRDPKNMRFLPADGAEVEMSSYWDRRIRSGDVVVLSEKAASQADKKISKT